MNLDNEAAAAFVSSAVLVRYMFMCRDSGPVCLEDTKPPTVTWLTPSAFSCLTAICDAFVPSIDPDDITGEDIRKALRDVFPDGVSPNGVIDTKTISDNRDLFCAGARSMGTHIRVAEAFQEFVPLVDQRNTAAVLSMLATSMGCFTLTGFAVPFQNMSLKNRTQALKGLRDSIFQPLRALYQALRRVTHVIYISYCERGTINPLWKHMRYDPRVVSSLASRLPTESLTPSLSLPMPPPRTTIGPWVLNADVVVVGSGAGGGVMAAELVKAGLRVIVLEKGGYYRADTFREWTEYEAINSVFENGGLLATSDGHIPIFAGSCVGGGTTINWSASFDLPEAVRKDWVSLGLNAFKEGGAFDKALREVKRMVGVNTRFSHRNSGSASKDTDADFIVNNNNEALWRGAESLGFCPERVPRNVKECVDCGNCAFGCPFGSKQSTVQALLEPLQAENEGKLLQILQRCNVRKIIMRNGRAVGVEAILSEFDENQAPGSQRASFTRQLVVNASIVVASCGSIHTPALLMRSGVKHPLVGRYLSLHPVAAVGGISSSSNSTGLNRGVGMGVVVKGIEMERENDRGWGLGVETPPFHMGIFGSTIPWHNGLQYKLSLLNYSQQQIFIAISRDRSSEDNRITINEDGEPVIEYTLTKQDEENVIFGQIQQLRLMRASGVKALWPIHENFPAFVPSQQRNGSDDFEKYLDTVRRAGIVTNRTLIFSAHQMGSCRMAATRKDGPVNPEGECWDCQNLYVADGSVFPTSLGINPMITIESISYMISQNIIQRLKSNTSARGDCKLSDSW